MPKVVLPPVTGGLNISQINDNFAKISDAFDEGVLWRDNPVGEPNTMQNDLDMNGQRIYNLPQPLLPHEPARLIDIGTGGGGPVGPVNASDVVFTPFKTITSTNAQGSIEQLKDERDVTQSSLSSLITTVSGVQTQVTTNSNDIAAVEGDIVDIEADIVALQASIGTTVQYSRNDIPTVNIPVGVSAIRTVGYSTPGDGGEALYKRVLSEPARPGKVRSLDGAWWQLVSWPINVRMFGAVGNGVADDTQAFKDAYQYFKTGTEMQGGKICIPRGHYILKDEWVFEGVDHVTNYWIEGDGFLNTWLDFSQAPAGKNGIVFNGASQIYLGRLFITGAPHNGIVLNQSFGSFVSQVKLSEMRVQGHGADGVYSNNSYLISMDDVWCVGNVGNGFSFVGNHTSIIADRVYASNNGGSGHYINGAVYIKYNAQSDGNAFYGYQLSNIRGGVINAPGTEGNGSTGFMIQSGVRTANIFSEYQGVEGLVISGAFNLRNGQTASVSNSFIMEAYNGVPIKVTLIGCVEDLLPGRSSITLDGTNGAIDITLLDVPLKANIVQAGTVKIKNINSLF